MTVQKEAPWTHDVLFCLKVAKHVEITYLAYFTFPNVEENSYSY